MKYTVVKGRAAAPLLPTVLTNADSDKEALGFLVPAAFSQAAASGKLLVAVAETNGIDEVVGHLLYGGTFPHIRIYQLFVCPPHRRKRIASLLLDTLAREAEEANYLSMRAQVATDLVTANAFWQRQRFLIVRAKPGGASRGRMLNIRVRELDTPRLFDLHPESAGPTAFAFSVRSLVPVPSYIIDVNVFLDLMKQRARAEDVARIFAAAWTRSVDVFVAEQFTEELRRASKEEHDPVLEMAMTIPRLPKLSDAILESVVSRLSPIVFAHKTEHGTVGTHDTSDLRHLATVVHHGVNGFVTSEKAILRNHAELRRIFGIDVIGTEEFASLVAPIQPREEKDFRASSCGDGILIMELTEDRRDAAIVFLLSLGIDEPTRTATLAAGTHQVPRHRIVVLSSSTSELVGYGSWDLTSGVKNYADAYLFIDEDHPDAQPIAAHLLREIAHESSKIGPCVLILHVPTGHARTRVAAFDVGFRPSESNGRSHDLRKISLGGAVGRDNWTQVSLRLKSLAGVELPAELPVFSGPETPISLCYNDATVVIHLVDLERLFSPAVFLLPGRDGMLIPIRRRYAEHLFSGSPQLPLLPRKQAALFTERAYFRSPNRVGSFQVGTPVLFYESGGPGNDGRACLFASASVTSNRVVWAETVSDRALQKGVVERDELDSMSKNGLVAMMHFDNTMILRKPVGLGRLRVLGAIDGANLVAPRALSTEILTSLFTEAKALAL